MLDILIPSGKNIQIRLIRIRGGVIELEQELGM